MIYLEKNIKDKIEHYLSKYIPNYKVHVFNTPPNTQAFPAVLVTEINNSITSTDTGQNIEVSSIGIEIDIVTKNMVINNKMLHKDNICNEILLYINKCMIDNTFTRISVLVTPIDDINLYRKTARYTGYFASNNL